MTSPMSPPPINEKVMSNPGIMTRVWVRFFQALVAGINNLSNEKRIIIPGQDGEDGQDGYTYPPIKGDQGIEGKMGIPGMDGEDAPGDYFMAPPGIDRVVFETYSGRYQYGGSLANGASIVLPAMTATTGSMTGEVIASAAGVITANAKFIADASGNVTIQYASLGNTVANSDTGVNLCIGTSVANPLTVKNRLGSTQTVMIALWYG